MVSAIDITIVIVYLLIMLGVGYLSGKNNKTQDDYFLAGHSMPWIPVALSVAATMISANGFIGGPGWAYTSGMAPVMVCYGSVSSMLCLEHYYPCFLSDESDICL